MEMIRIRTEMRLANPEDSNIEAEKLEAMDEAEAAVLENLDDNLVHQMEGMEETEREGQGKEQQVRLFRQQQCYVQCPEYNSSSSQYHAFGT